MPFSFTTFHPALYPNTLHPGTTHSLPLLLLRLEGVTLFASGLYLFHRLQNWHRSTIKTPSSPAKSPTGLADPVSWSRCIALLLLPDLGMVGFLRNPRLGSWIYNAAHTEIFPLVLVVTLAGDALNGALTAKAKKDDDADVGALGLRRTTWAKWMAIGLIWLAHIGMDRMIGAGLKYETGFGHTHVGVMG